MICFWLLALPSVAAQNSVLRVAAVENGENLLTFKAQLTQKLFAQKSFEIIDEDLTKAAVSGAKPANLFNLSLEDAKNLGAAVDCDFFIVIKSGVWRRSSFQKDVYFESFAVLFLISARSGRLISWEHNRFEADASSTTEKLLLAEVPNIVERLKAKILTANERERTERAASIKETVLISDLPNEAVIEQQNFRVPLPFRSLKPQYTAAANKLSIEATVDVAAELNERGEVIKTEVIRWAGFDLDEAAAETVKKMQFRPALRDGKAVSLRVILRYNFRDLQREDEK